METFFEEPFSFPIANLTFHFDSLDLSAVDHQHWLHFFFLLFAQADVQDTLVEHFAGRLQSMNLVV